MNKNKNNNSKIPAQKAGKLTKTQRRKRNQKRRNRGVDKHHTSAPIAVSDDLQQYVRFSKGSKDASLKMTCCIPFYQICSNRHDGTNLLKGGFSLGPSNQTPYVALSALGGQVHVSGTDNPFDYISPVIELLGSTFTRYKIMGLTFVYEPQSPTTVGDRLVFAYAEDPEHPMIIHDALADATQTQLLALEDSVAFAPWRSWELDVSESVKQDLMYIHNQSTSSSVDNRFSMFGAIGCLGSIEPTTTTAQTVYGILYARVVIEFYEFCPQIQSIPTTLKTVQSIKKLESLKEEVKNHDDDEDTQSNDCPCGKCVLSKKS